VVASLAVATASARTTAAPGNVVPPTISGIAVVGETLTAAPGAWTGTAPVTFGYAWQRCDAVGAGCLPIAAASGTTYVVELADVGATLRVAVTATNSDGAVTAVSGPTVLVTTPTAPEPTGEPVIGGTAREGQSLSTTNGSWTGTDPIAFTYHWVRCGADGGRPDGSDCEIVGGASSSTYTLTSADVGRRLRVRVIASNSTGSQVSTSNPSDLVAQSTTVGPPRATLEPSLTGTPAQGRLLSGNAGTWAGSSPISFTNQWVRCPADGGAPDGSNCTAVPSATSTTYSPAGDDVGHRLRFRVTASNGLGTQSAASNATAPVTASSSTDTGFSGDGTTTGGGNFGFGGTTGEAPTNTRLPAITGTAARRRALTASAGSWTGTAPITYAYQWLRCGTSGGSASGADCDEIDDATSSRYVLTADDVGERLRVEVEASNAEGSDSAVSNATARVTGTAAAGTPKTPTKRPTRLPAGAIRLAPGRISIPVTSVALPVRLVVRSVTLGPTPVRTKGAALRVRVFVVDSRGYAVRDALVQARMVPALTTAMPEQPTGRDGGVTFRTQARAGFPPHVAPKLDVYVRVRKPGESPNAGVSNRRLVRVTAGR
jgi:hypothetical protein